MVFPVPPFYAINVTVYTLTTLCFEQLVVEFSKVRFLLGLRECRGSYSPAAFLPGTHSWATSNPSHAESAFSRSSSGSSLVGWRIVSIACHNMCTPVGTVANAQACAAIRSFVALESDSVELEHWGDLIQRDGPFYRDGYYELTDKPGLGIELNEEVCRRHLTGGSAYFGG